MNKILWFNDMRVYTAILGYHNDFIIYFNPGSHNQSLKI